MDYSIGLESIISMFALLVCQSLCGLGLGLFITTYFSRRDQVIQAGIALIFPCIILSGVIWPRQAMPHLLRTFSEILPVTLPCDLAQSLLLKPLSQLTFMAIFWGFVIPLLWAMIFCFIGRIQLLQRTEN